MWPGTKRTITSNRPRRSPTRLPRPAATRGAQGAITDLNGAGYVVLSACTNEQSASEMTDGDVDMGRLSYCLSRVLSAATPHTTYREVFDEVRAMFRSRFSDQSPQLDGNANTYLLGGTATEPPTSILVYPAKSDGNQPGASVVYQLDAGKLQGMTIGSMFAIYAKNAEEFNTETKIAEARNQERSDRHIGTDTYQADQAASGSYRSPCRGA